MHVDIGEIAYIKSRGIDKRINQTILLFILSILSYMYFNTLMGIALFLICCANAAIALVETAKALNDYNDIEKESRK